MDINSSVVQRKNYARKIDKKNKKRKHKCLSLLDGRKTTKSRKKKL